jgi:tryptophanyl-tRNA synthetase
MFLKRTKKKSVNSKNRGTLKIIVSPNVNIEKVGTTKCITKMSSSRTNKGIVLIQHEKEGASKAPKELV